MRNTISLSAVALLLALCGGCASQGGMKDQPSTYRAGLDSEVMAAVENQAGSSGTQVYWINPPRKAKHQP